MKVETVEWLEAKAKTKAVMRMVGEHDAAYDPDARMDRPDMGPDCVLHVEAGHPLLFARYEYHARRKGYLLVPGFVSVRFGRMALC